MAVSRVSVQSTVERPAGRPAVIIPDVFPSAGPRDDLAGVHDILKGTLPKPDSGDRQGWLRLAVESGNVPAYVDPALPPEEQERILSSYRQAQTGTVTIERIEEVRRAMVRIEALTGQVRVDAASIYFPRPEQAFYEAWPVESALAFSGRIALKGDDEKLIFGMHFPSGKQNGWARVTDPSANNDESAKLQHPPAFRLGTMEDIVHRS